MASIALHSWLTTRTTNLDEIENAHRSVGGSGPGRRYATQQINQAYAVLLSAQFQGFCRDLYSECVVFLVSHVTPPAIQVTLRNDLVSHRKLDWGNPNPGNIGSDFNRLGLNFWPRVDAEDSRNPQRKRALEELNHWRNAIAHQDFDPSKLGGIIYLTLRHVRGWRLACDGLAVAFDNVMRGYLQTLLGVPPW